MYWSEHEPPHFHAIYEEYAAMFSIERGEVIRGKLPKKATELVKEWANMYRQDLLENWRLAQSEQELKKILPLE